MSIRIILCTASRKYKETASTKKLYIEKRYTRGEGRRKDPEINFISTIKGRIRT